VANQYSGTVSVIDAITRTVITTVTVGAMPLGVAVNPAGTLGYVTNRDSDTVSVIDTATNTVAATVNVAAGGGDGPVGIAVNSAGTRAYITNIWDSTFSTIDTTTNTVLSTIPVGGTGPGGVDLNSAGTLAYVANTATDTVSIIDTSTNIVVSTVPVGSGPIALGKFIAEDTTPPPPSTDELLSDLLAYVTGIGPGKSLAAKVRAAQTALADGDTTGACDSLQALINETTAQSGKKLTVEQANHIIDAATDIRTQIGC
jgi:YVTN family beta-propeller protein